METIKSLAHETARRQVEILTSTSSPTNDQKRNVNDVINVEKETQNFKRIKEATNEKINQIAEALDNYVKSIQRDLKFQVHDETGNIMVQVTSQDTGEVIREIPPEELLDLAARIEELAGTLFDEKV